MRRAATLGLAFLLAGCAGAMETLQPAAGTRPAIRAAIEAPRGPGPFPAAVLLHGCAGPRPNTASWSARLVAQGYLVVVPDQFGPRGIAEVCTQGDTLPTLFRRVEDSLALVRLVQARPDVRPDRVFLIGFSMGGQLTAALLDESLRHVWAGEGGAGLMPAGGVAVYPECRNFPQRIAAPLLVIAGGEDDWTPAEVCERRVAMAAGGPVTPRLLVIPGAHHGWDDPGNLGLVTLRDALNAHSPTGRGATVSYSAAATRRSQEAALAFLDAPR